MSVVDARFSGGHLTVDTHELPSGDLLGVRFSTPGLDLPLFPDEARTLAVKLIEAAAQAERNEPNDWTDDE
ncbi:hypothetical protein [Subtercola lobariae]|uniref:Uncharacterized protein n=1 Tax=Subtercola lobariae TaxID=1588641 RepID=A0A917AZU9_9MICO|nr:hypothetical protein [Subtercola lobariae]GGF11314.1 hypothetical protein GCM10011399_01410 [Subtercola lobariae]